MTRPKFEIGEEVILQSIDFPEYNGDYSVINCKYWDDEVGYIYDLGIPLDSRHLSWVKESSLRKKHPPARDDNGEIVSFKQMMNNLIGVSVS